MWDIKKNLNAQTNNGAVLQMAFWLPVSEGWAPSEHFSALSCHSFLCYHRWNCCDVKLPLLSSECDEKICIRHERTKLVLQSWDGFVLQAYMSLKWETQRGKQVLCCWFSSCGQQSVCLGLPSHPHTHARMHTHTHRYLYILAASLPTTLHFFNHVSN